MAGSNPRANDLFNALGHPLRRRVLREMLDASGAEISPRELAQSLAEQLSALSYHVRVLAECGAIELVRTEQIRGSTQHFYRPILKESWALSALQTGEDRLVGKGDSRGKRRADGVP